MWTCRLASALLHLFVLLVLATSASGQLINKGFTTISGRVESISPGAIVVKDEMDKAITVRLQANDDEGVQLSNGSTLRYPAEIHVKGEFAADELKVGQVVRIQSRVNRLGRTQDDIHEVSLITGDDSANGLEVVKAGETASDYAACEIIGPVSALRRGTLVVKIPANNGFTRKTALSFRLAEGAVVTFDTGDIHRAGPGAKVTIMAAQLNTGDLVAKKVDIEVTNKTTGRGSLDEALLAKYRHLSDEPQKPRLIRSAHYAFMTDVSDRQAQIILDKLETMTGLLSEYFGRGPSRIVEGFIVRDLSVWPEGLLTEPAGIEKIRQRAGICFNSSLGNERRAVLYSSDDHGVIQHECTHGFCHLAFGSTGPTWLAEGVAEMGQYWKADQIAVDVDPTVISYLQQTSPKKELIEIAVPGRTAAGTWRDYAWRWALCYLSAYNPNYADRFKPLAIALMEQRDDVSFASVYGPVAQQIAFEYDLLLQTLDNGYRADLCAWQWNAKFVPLAAKRQMQKKVVARYGWQASGVTVQKGVTYEVVADGKWSIAQDGSEVDADGDADGRGKLVASIFTDYQLSEEFELGKEMKFTSPNDGQLFLRCRDDWNKLADNSGELTISLRISQE